MVETKTQGRRKIPGGIVSIRRLGTVTSRKTEKAMNGGFLRYNGNFFLLRANRTTLKGTMHTISRLGLSLGVFLCFLLPITEIQAASQNNLQNKSTATDGSRVALLIGNGDYRSLYLKDAVPSVRQLEGVLRELGFEVARLENSTQKQLKRSIDDF